MDACRRALVVLLFLLLSSAGALTSSSTGERGREGARAPHVLCSNVLVKSSSAEARESVRHPPQDSDDNGSAAPSLAGQGWTAAGSFELLAGSFDGHRPGLGKPLAGRPRGPPRTS